MVAQQRERRELRQGTTNATLSVFNKDGSKIKDALVVLKKAKPEGDRLTFGVDVPEGDFDWWPAALFIGRFAFGGFHAGGFAGGVGGLHAGGGFVRGGAVGVGRVGADGVWHRLYVARGGWYRAPYGAAGGGLPRPAHIKRMVLRRVN